MSMPGTHWDAAGLPGANGWLQALVADWQIVADLSFADLVLWVEQPPAAETAGGRWKAIAQVRPTTGPTSLVRDVTGSVRDTHPITDPPDPGLWAEAVPVRRAGVQVAVLVRQRAAALTRRAGELEAAYLDAADALFEMVSAGDFPVPRPSRVDSASGLRVGDGFIRVGVDGVVQFASPNALSAYRRLGHSADLVGSNLADVTAGMLDDRPTERAVRGVLAGRAFAEAEFANSRATVDALFIPLRRRKVDDGAVVLLCDVTELRLRERELVSKEATIREIHHRVKNNLQTVAALLRLQGRRSGAPEARAALEEAERRVGSIALVHETLSRSFDETVDFDDIADRLLRGVLDVSAAGVRAERIGSFGALSGAIATPLAMVLTELIQNAVQHAFALRGGRVTIAVNRIRGRLRLRVSDDGVGLPAGFSPTDSLGLSIVSTLVESELGGRLEFHSRPEAGTTVVMELTLD
jgi:two-component sensor histidine kinase